MRILLDPALKPPLAKTVPVYEWTYEYVWPESCLHGEQFDIRACAQEDADRLAEERAKSVSKFIQVKLVDCKETGLRRSAPRGAREVA